MSGAALLFVLTGRIGGIGTVFSSTSSYVVRRRFFQPVRVTDSRGWPLGFVPCVSGPSHRRPK
ncbi:hypothetical protein [Rhodoferax sp.]|uniref:hypothetical protein n=1 Tax=Rhodoferax sp. TaxID=50421 RepID=UPI00274ADABD|nr:hypothetical protein [Rhodoferax sp.]